VDAEFAKGGKVIEATYTTPMLAHAAMEPPAAVAEYKDGKVEVWTSTQNPQAAQETWPAALGIDKKNVTCHVTLLGGGFGRKSKPDFAAEAAYLSKQLGKPGEGRLEPRGRHQVRLLPRHAAACTTRRCSARTGSRRRCCTARRSSRSRRRSRAIVEYPLPFELDLALTTRRTTCEHPGRERPRAAHVRIGWFRAVTNNFHFFALGSFMDELAHAGRPGSARVPPRRARAGQGARPQGAGRGVLELRRAVRPVSRSTRGACDGCSRWPARRAAGPS
jgi:isoquinoline 1-oxidoreductase beta subunit